MNKYISIEEVERIIRNDVPLKLLMTNSLNCAIKNGIEIAEIISKKAKPADVVEVVRCKDCRMAEEYLMIDGWYYCNNNELSHKPNHFCSYGERKENNEVL